MRTFEFVWGEWWERGTYIALEDLQKGQFLHTLLYCDHKNREKCIYYWKVRSSSKCTKMLTFTFLFLFYFVLLISFSSVEGLSSSNFLTKVLIFWGNFSSVLNQLLFPKFCVHSTTFIIFLPNFHNLETKKENKNIEGVWNIP